MYYVKRAIRILRTLFIFNSWQKNVIDLKYDFGNEIKVSSQGVELTLFNLVLPKGSFEFVIRSYEKLRKFKEVSRVSCEAKDGLFFLTIDNLRFNLTTEEEFFIIQEVFFEGSYCFTFPASTVVIDIGMNVGLATLYFASKPEVTHVYSFEPFLPTYQQAQVNLNLNPDVNKKVSSSHFGLSNKKESIDVSYDYENKGQVGIYGTSQIRSEVKEKKTIQIELKSAVDILSEIISKHSGSPVIVKMDCEGSEYNIIRSLNEAGLLNKLDAIMIEWHERGYSEITDQLVANGFKAFSTQSLYKKVGMIYAAR